MYAKNVQSKAKKKKVGETRTTCLLLGALLSIIRYMNYSNTYVSDIYSIHILEYNLFFHLTSSRWILY